MNFYTMKMICGKDGTQSPQSIKKFVEQRGIVGIGEPEETQGSGTFQNSIQIGDIVVLRQPFALLKIKSGPMQYQGDNDFPDFNWLCIIRQVEVLSWHEEEEIQNDGDFYFNAQGYQATCAKIEKPDKLTVVTKWLDVIQGTKMKKDLSKLLLEVYNLILTGAPGTGKTYLAQEIAREITSKNISSTQKQSIGFVQFHPSYDYTDFVEGLRPKPLSDKDGNIGFVRQDGVFKNFCKEALKNPDDKFVFIIDEINRGDIAKIFGELFFAIDPGYRDEENPTPIKTQYQNLIPIDSEDPFKDGFIVPKNIYIIGTMNDIDRNVESMDFAIRRRFTWQEIEPVNNTLMWDDVKSGIGNFKEQAQITMKAINNAITGIEGLGSQYQLGAAYFLKLKNYNGNFTMLWERHIAHLMHEYLRGIPRADEHFNALKKVWFDSLLPMNNSNSEASESQTEI